MARLPKLITRTLSFRLTLRVMIALASLLMAALLIMFYFSRKAVKEEVVQDARQTLETTVGRIDNVLLNVEQATGNIYWKMMPHINEPEKLDAYMNRLKEINPYIVNCNIVWNTDTAEVTGWIDTQSEGDAITIFSLPIFSGQHKVGTMAVGVSLAKLSNIVLEAKPSPNGFCTLLRKDGSIVIHPDSVVLNQNIIALTMKDDVSMTQAAESMLKGETGYRRVQLNDVNYYVFYKPFERVDVPGRTIAELGWSVGVILPEEDIFGDYIRLHYIVIMIAIAGLLLLLVSCYSFFHRQLMPLRELEKSARRIAEGHYDEPIRDRKQQDEVGRLMIHFRSMQQSLSTRMGEMQQLSATLKERGEELQTTYEQAQAAARMKTNFLYNMSDQMTGPVADIREGVRAISDTGKLTEEETNRLVEKIQAKGGRVTALLNQLIKDSEQIMN